MMLVNMAFVSIVSAKEVVNAAENTKDGNVGIRVLVLSVPIYGDLNPTSETDTFSFTIPSGQSWGRISADVDPMYTP